METSTKDRLLAAARTCLLRNGYGGTSVRELIAESGTNQASINYHYGSKERLLNQALFELNSRWGEELFGVLAPATDDRTLADVWQSVIDSIVENQQLWHLNFEAVALAQHNATIGEGLAERGRQAIKVLATTLGRLSPDAPAEAIQAAGSVYYALLTGVAMQYIVDPDHAPTAQEMARVTTVSTTSQSL